MKRMIPALFFLLTLSACDTDPEPVQPNIIFILADDLGYNDVSCYREANLQVHDRPPTCQTPNIDQLAIDGMRFSDFYCGAAVCSPSRAALLTGRNTTRVGIYNWIPTNTPMHLRDEEITIPELLKAKSYNTGHFGKWHLTSEKQTHQPRPNDQGFDYSFFAYNNAVPSHQNPENYFRNGEPVGKMEGYACQLVVDEAIGWLDSVKYKETPFYMSVWFNEPHERVAAPDSLTEKHSYLKEYYGAIENMDHAIGRLIKYLEDNNLRQNTLIMFSSDNGSEKPGSCDPLRGEKAFNFEGGVRVPFIISWPGHVPENAETNFPASFTDILPSLAGLTGIPLPDDRVYDGMDLHVFFLGWWKGGERSEPIFFYRYFHDPMCMLREREWVLLAYEHPLPYKDDYNQIELANIKPEEGKPTWSAWGFQESHMDYILQQEPTHFELYQIYDDPGQHHDVSADYPEIFNAMKEKMLSLRSEMIDEGGIWYK